MFVRWRIDGPPPDDQLLADLLAGAALRGELAISRSRGVSRSAGVASPRLLRDSKQERSSGPRRALLRTIRASARGTGTDYRNRLRLSHKPPTDPVRRSVMGRPMLRAGEDGPQVGRDHRQSDESRCVSHQLGSEAFWTPLCNSLACLRESRPVPSGVLTSMRLDTVASVERVQRSSTAFARERARRGPRTRRPLRTSCERPPARDRSRSRSCIREAAAMR